MIDDYKNKENRDEDSNKFTDTATDSKPTIEITDPDKPVSNKNKNKKAKEVLHTAGDQI